MEEDLRSFDLKLIKERMCAKLQRDWDGKGNVLFFHTSHLYNMAILWRLNWYSDIVPFLPPFDKSIIADISLHSLVFVSALWAGVTDMYLLASEEAIKTSLGNSTNYLAFHRRAGINCEEYFKESEREDGLRDDYRWVLTKEKGEDHIEHETFPLCNVTQDSVQKICNLTNNSCKSTLVCWDHEGNFTHLSSLHKVGAKIGSQVVDNAISDVKANKNIDLNAQNINKMLLEMFLAINADVFVMMPYSSWSWHVAQVRYVLHKTTVPLLKQLEMQGQLSLWFGLPLTKEENVEEWRRFAQKYSSDYS
jgi:hypothetical protein